jgi:hypothetical protein
LFQDRYSLRSSSANGRFGNDRFSRSKLGAGGDWRQPTGTFTQKRMGMDGNVSRMLLYLVAGFLAMLLVAYIATAHGDAVRDTGDYVRTAGRHVRGSVLVFFGILRPDSGAASDTIKFFYAYAILPVIIATIGRFRMDLFRLNLCFQ